MERNWPSTGATEHWHRGTPCTREHQVLTRQSQSQARRAPGTEAVERQGNSRSEELVEHRAPEGAERQRLLGTGESGDFYGAVNHLLCEHQKEQTNEAAGNEAKRNAINESIRQECDMNAS